MCCSTAQHCWTRTTSTHPHSREYTYVQLFAMHHFWGGRASLKSSCINFRSELSTIATLMFVVLHVLLNNFALLNPVQSYHLHTHQYTICIILQCTAFKDVENPWKVYDTFNGSRHCLLKSCQMKIKMLNNLHVNKYTTFFAVHITNPLL